MTEYGFKSLKVWQRSKDLAIGIYKMTNSSMFLKDFGLRDQIRRAAVSISSNIAEGAERGSNKDSVRFFFMAKGSIAELMTQLEIALGIGYLEGIEYKSYETELMQIGKMIGALIKARRN
jgi:four helix bundle protein